MTSRAAAADAAPEDSAPISGVDHSPYHVPLTMVPGPGPPLSAVTLMQFIGAH